MALNFDEKDYGNNDEDLRRVSFFKQEENFIAKLGSLIKRRLFTANYLMIHSFRMPTFIFIGLMIIEFLQLNYFSLYKLEIVNDFSKTQNRTLSAIETQNTQGNPTNETYTNNYSTFNLDSNYNALKYLNYWTIIVDLKNEYGIIEFQVALYIHLLMFFILIMAIMLLGRKVVMRSEQIFSGKIKNITKSSDLNQQNDFEQQSGMGFSKTWQLDALILSISFYFASSLLVIPTFILISTSFDCTKLSQLASYSNHTQSIQASAYPFQDSLSNTYTNTTTETASNSFQCLDLQHIIMITLSVVFGILIASFLAMQGLLFQDLNLKKGIPWRQQANRLQQIKLLQKLTCVMFNFDILTDKPVAIGVFCSLSFVILVKRYQYSHIYHVQIRRVQFFVDAVTFWLSFWSFISYSSFYFSIYSFIVLLILGFIPFYLFVLEIFDKGKQKRFLLKEYKKVKEMGSEVNAEIYFGYLIGLIKESNTNEKSRLLLFGYLRSHWYDCKKGKIGECICAQLVQRIDLVMNLVYEEKDQRAEIIDVDKIQKQIEEIDGEIKLQNEEKLKKLQQRQASKDNRMDNLMQDVREFNDMLGGQLNPTFQDDHIDSLIESDHITQQIEDDELQNVQNEDIHSIFKIADKSKVEDAINEFQKKGFLSKQIKQLFFKFVYQLIEEAANDFPFSFRLKYLAAYIQIHFLKNVIKGLFEILVLEKKNKIPLEWQFFLFKVKGEIEDDMDNYFKEKSKTQGRIDVIKVYQFSKSLQDFENKVQIVSERCVEFWKELLKVEEFNANSLHSIGTNITIINIKITNLVNEMFDINPNHGYLLRMYALFLQHVMNNEEEGQKYYAKFMNAQKTFSHYQAASLKEELIRNFQSNIKYAILVMRVTTQEIGIVEDVNHEVRNILGYRRQDLIKKNISMIMPKCIGKLHDQFVQNYLDTAKTKILNKQREVFAVKKNGFMLQIFVYVTSVPMIESDGIKFVGFIKKVDEKKFTNLLSPPPEVQHQKSIQFLAAPNGNIYGLNEQTFKNIGLPTYFTDEDDERLSDFNMYFLVKSYKKVLFNCLRYSPVGQKAVISTSGFKNNIVQEMHSKDELKHIRRVSGKYNVLLQAQPIDFGYQGGAYLPTIFFRMYIIDKVLKKAKIQQQQQIQSPKSPMRSNNNLFAGPFNMEHRSNTKRNLYMMINSGKTRNFSDDEKDNKEESDGDFEENEISEIDSSLDQSSRLSNKSERKHKLSMKQKVNHSSKKIENITQKEQEIQDYLYSSMSSASFSKETRTQDLARLKEFRKMVSSRTEPQVIISLRRVVMFVVLLTASLIGINLGFKLKFYGDFISVLSEYNLLNDIIIDLYHVHTGFKSIINIKNGIQEDQIEKHILKGQFSKTLQSQLRINIQSLNDHKNELVQLKDLVENEIKNEEEGFEITSIDIDGKIIIETQSLNLALSQVISKSLDLIDDSQIEKFQNKTFIDYINKISNKTQFKFGKLGNEIDVVAKNLYFVETNIFQGIINLCEIITVNLEAENNIQIEDERVIFLVLLSSVLFIITFSLFALLYISKNINKTKIQSLSLYSELRIKDVKNIIKRITIFLNIIKQNSEALSDSWIKNQDMEQLEEADEQFNNLSVNQSESSAVGRNIYQNHSSVNYIHDEVRQLATRKTSFVQSRMNDISYRENDLSIRNLQEDHNAIKLNIIKKPDSSKLLLEPKDTTLDQNKTQSPLDIQVQLELNEEEKEQMTVGHVENFKMVSSNSGRGFITVSIVLFFFLVSYICVNFVIFIPLFQNLKQAHYTKHQIILQYQNYYKIYAQLVQDFSHGYYMTDKTNKSILFEEYLMERFQIIEQIDQQIKYPPLFFRGTVDLILSFNTDKFCDQLETNLKNSSTFNKTFCLAIDSSIVAQQGFHTAQERQITEFNKIRSQNEFKLENYTSILSFFKKDERFSIFQAMMQKIFTPSYEVIRDSIFTSFDTILKDRKKIDISLVIVVGTCQLFIMLAIWPRFLRQMNEQVSKSRGILTLIPSRLIVSNKSIIKIIKENQILSK